MGTRDVKVNLYTFEESGGVSDEDKVHPRTAHEGPEEYRYSSSLS
jgi:hypothetical protein